MVRPVRPSDVFALPDPEVTGPAPGEPQAPRPPAARDSRARLWPLAAAILAAGLVATGVARGAIVAEERIVPVVTTVDEQHAVLALAVYGAEADVVEELAQRRRDPRPGNPQRIRLAAAAGAGTVEEALARARAVAGADPLATAYTDDPGHARLLAVLTALGDLDPDLPSAERDRALLLAAVRTPAVDRLRAYVRGLPAGVVAVLRDHPAAGRALRALDHDERQVTG